MTQRIVISTETAEGLSAPISPHFGRCPFFTMIDVEGEEIRAVQAVANPYYPNHQPGQVPAFIHSLGAQVMLSGGMGGRAIAFFEEYDIQVATGAADTVQSTLERYFKGELYGAGPCSESAEHGHG